jgi:retron-type reverse transcriptase
MKEIADKGCYSCKNDGINRICRTCNIVIIDKYKPLNPIKNYEDELLEALIYLIKFMDYIGKNRHLVSESIMAESLSFYISNTKLIEKITGKKWDE